METIEKGAFKVIGIKARTTNEEGKAAAAIGALWNRFMSEGIPAKIPNRLDSSFLSIYTNYEKDHTKPYDAILGCRVSSLEDIPEGMVGQEFGLSAYTKFTAKGDLSKGAVYQSWKEIWEQNLDRTYTADFEVYGEKAQNPANAEVDIFIAVSQTK